MNKQDLLNYVEEIKDELIDVSTKIWSKPEISGQEKESANLMRKVLKDHGFTIKELEGMEHSFIGEFGSGSPVIAVLGEYDALPGLSQAVETRFNPVKANEPGHGCGHNLLGTGALGAALAIKLPNLQSQAGLP